MPDPVLWCKTAKFYFPSLMVKKLSLREMSPRHLWRSFSYFLFLAHATGIHCKSLTQKSCMDKQFSDAGWMMLFAKGGEKPWAHTQC